MNFWSILVFYEEENFLSASKNSPQITKTTVGDDLTLNENEEITYDMLRKWRTQTAQQEGISNYLIAHNSDLIRLVKANIKSIEDLKQVQGWGPKAQKYGEAILAILNQ